MLSRVFFLNSLFRDEEKGAQASICIYSKKEKVAKEQDLPLTSTPPNKDFQPPSMLLLQAVLWWEREKWNEGRTAGEEEEDLQRREGCWGLDSDLVGMNLSMNTAATFSTLHSWSCPDSVSCSKCDCLVCSLNYPSIPELVFFWVPIINEQELARQVGAHPGSVRCLQSILDPLSITTLSPLALGL